MQKEFACGVGEQRFSAWKGLTAKEICQPSDVAEGEVRRDRFLGDLELLLQPIEDSALLLNDSVPFAIGLGSIVLCLTSTEKARTIRLPLEPFPGHLFEPRSRTPKSESGRRRGVIILLMTAEEIVAEALKLDRKARGKVASRLLRSLDEEQEKLSPEECEKLWLEEAERRLEDWEQGKVKGIPSEEVFARARAFLSS